MIGQQRDGLSLANEQSDGTRQFAGRIFSSLLDRAGFVEHRCMERTQVEQALELGLTGPFWFRGIDVDLARIITKQDLRGLLAYGVRGEYRLDLWGESGFIVNPVPITQDSVQAVQALLGNELHSW